jgi:hypothetical protein
MEFGGISSSASFASAHPVLSNDVPVSVSSSSPSLSSPSSCSSASSSTSLHSTSSAVMNSTSSAVTWPCAGCGDRFVKVLRCGRCKAVDYCGRVCQQAHRKIHKTRCVEPEFDVVVCFSELGLELRAKRATLQRHSQIALYTTIPRRDGDLVLRETSRVVGSRGHLAALIYASPLLLTLMMPREGTIDLRDDVARQQSQAIQDANPIIPADIVPHLYSKIHANAWQVSAGDGIPCLPGSKGTGKGTHAPDVDVKSETLAIFAMAQFIDNACAPNIGQVIQRNASCCEYRGYALGDMAAGTKLGHSYLFDWLPRAQRHAALQFECRCTQCLSGPGAPRQSVWPASLRQLMVRHHATGGTMDPTLTYDMISEMPVPTREDDSTSAAVLDAAVAMQTAWDAKRLDPLDFATRSREELAHRSPGEKLQLLIDDFQARLAGGESPDTVAIDMQRLLDSLPPELLASLKSRLPSSSSSLSNATLHSTSTSSTETTSTSNNNSMPISHI